ncbi:RNA polymerase sigma factor [Cryptosporangium arvum]|uniref:RNA polymerase sigma factor, sigma-70 family n=1 Tax=Cryptosporangium arvum DSM 44712 TaxID=927661 RepID=A0A010ZUJ6_9ACTN|nr:RNA polymerase sigma factor [Cryptosporangium arvum]EXG82354.1 RNA polymerase sigma factor, sigma-70 family [Cryptosporangium arvum DSM 44712]
MDDPDLPLLTAVARGDQRALEVLYERHGQALLAYAVSMLGDLAAAQEAVQDTMLACWRQASGFASRSTVRTWLFGIVRRQGLSRLRRRTEPSMDTRDLSVADSSPGPEQTALARAEVAEVRAALKHLSDEHREVLWLTFGAELPQAGIAEMLGIPVGTVKSRLHLARAALGAALPEEAHR